MAEVLRKIDVRMPSQAISIEAQGFWDFLSWQDGRRDLEKWVSRPFLTTLKNKTGYSNENIPSGKRADDVRVPRSGVVFEVTTTPTSASTSYKAVNESFGNYLDFLSEQHSSGVKRKGIHTIEGECYVQLNHLTGKLDQDIGNLLEGSRGVRQNVKLKESDSVTPTGNGSLPVVFSRDYAAFTEENALAYLSADAFIGQGNARTKSFQKLLLEDSLNSLGESPQEPIALAYACGDVIFKHQLEPRTTTKYADVINAVVKPEPKRIAKNSKIGDFTMLNMMRDSNLESTLYDKGLVGCDFAEDYNAVTRGDHTFVRLAGVQKRLGEYRETFQSPSIEQNISLRPN